MKIKRGEAKEEKVKVTNDQNMKSKNMKKRSMDLERTKKKSVNRISSRFRQIGACSGCKFKERKRKKPANGTSDGVGAKQSDAQLTSAVVNVCARVRPNDAANTLTKATCVGRERSRRRTQIDVS